MTQCRGFKQAVLLSLVRGDPAFSMLRPVDNGAWQARGGLPCPQPWEEVELTRVDDAREDFIAVDCFSMNTEADGLLVSDHARMIIGPLLSEAVSFWPVRVLGHIYWWLNCMAQVKALDHRNTDADWSSVSGDWGSFSWISITRRLSFLPNEVKQAPALFRIPEFPQGVLFARDELRSAVERHGLTGFKFDLVWSVRGGGVVNPAGVGFAGMFNPMSNNDVELKRSVARETLARRASKIARYI